MHSTPLALVPAAATLAVALLAVGAAVAHTADAADAADAADTAHRGDRLTVHDPLHDVHPSDARGRSDIDARRIAFSVDRADGRAVVRFVVDLPRRVPAREHLQGFVVWMHGGGHDYYVTGNQTPESVVFADRRPGKRAYDERSRGTGRTFTRTGHVVLRVPLASFSGRRLVIDRVYTHLGPLGTGHVPRDRIAPPPRALHLRRG
mgnify:CR=1 FL=1